MKCTFLVKGNKKDILDAMYKSYAFYDHNGVRLVRAECYELFNDEGNYTGEENDIFCVRCMTAFINYIWLKIYLRKTKVYAGWGDPK